MITVRAADLVRSKWGQEESNTAIQLKAVGWRETRFHLIFPLVFGKAPTFTPRMTTVWWVTQRAKSSSREKGRCRFKEMHLQPFSALCVGRISGQRPNPEHQLQDTERSSVVVFLRRAALRSSSGHLSGGHAIYRYKDFSQHFCYKVRQGCGSSNETAMMAATC